MLLLLACSQQFDEKLKEADAVGTEETGAGDTATEDTDTGRVNPRDRDGDGSPVDEDCDDTDPSAYPGAEEIWYDGIDQACDGGNDYDRDGDGTDHPEDCDDRNPEVHPGVADAWYDGIDSDCAGNDDYDQDGDGERIMDAGGGDCDDTDAATWPGGLEILDDLADTNCDGDPNSATFTTLDAASGSGLQGPRMAESNGYVIITFLADSYLDPVAATVQDTGAVYHLVDAEDVTAGVVATGNWYWDSTYTFDDGVDFWADDDYWLWGYGFRIAGTRYLIVDAWGEAEGEYQSVGLDESTSQTIDDVELTEAPDGTVHAVACDSGGGRLAWMNATPSAYFRSSMVDADEASSAASDACLVRPDTAYAMAAKRSDGELARWTYADGLESAPAMTGWNVYDMETTTRRGSTAFVAAEGEDGVFVELDGAGSRLTLADAQEIDVDVDGLGRMYVAVTDGTTAAWLYWGRPDTGFERVQLNTTLTSVADLDVHVTDGDVVIVAARGGAEVVWGVWQGR